MTAATRIVRVTRVTSVETRGCDEVVVVEEPLELRVAGELVASTMRTPGDDHYLALGFLLAEGIIRSADDVGSVYPCGRSGDAGYATAIDVLPGPLVQLDLDRLVSAQRRGNPNSACGACGRDGIADLCARFEAVPVEARSIPHTLLSRVPALLLAHQPAFARTGGLHAACAVTLSGDVRAHAEDIGRHNAVDKVVGKLLCAAPQRREPLLLAVSSRASFEIVQKAAAYGFVAVASISAPSSLAVDAALAAGITLASFVREGRFTVYAHVERVDPQR